MKTRRVTTAAANGIPRPRLSFKVLPLSPVLPESPGGLFVEGTALEVAGLTKIEEAVSDEKSGCRFVGVVRDP